MENTYKTYLINTIESLKDKPMATIMSSFSGAGINYKVQNKTPDVVEYWVDAYKIKGTITVIKKNKPMQKTELEIVREQNEIMATALRDLIDYHNHIGNRDCPYSNNEIFTTLYNLANNGINDASNICIDKPETPYMFNSKELLASFQSICDDYNTTLIITPKNV
jgi:hypothetical protein